MTDFDKIASYPYGGNAGKVCKTELLEFINIKLLILLMLLMKVNQNIIQIDHKFLTIHTEY